jgi:hypothetical protein
VRLAAPLYQPLRQPRASLTPFASLCAKQQNMGNLCSKSSNQPDNFAGQGRVVGSSSQPQTPSSAPVPQKISTHSPGRPLGGGGGGGSGAVDDPRSAAAKAAEVCWLLRPCETLSAVLILFSSCRNGTKRSPQEPQEGSYLQILKRSARRRRMRC